MNSTKRIGGIYLLFIILNILIAISIPAFFNVNNCNTTQALVDEILDQKQELHNTENPIRSGLLVAQEFKPSKTPLTKVMLKVRKTLVIQEPLIVSIREELDDFDMTFIPVLGSEIPFNTFWVEFDFEDIEVDVDKTYYIVVRSPASQSFWWQTRLNNSDDGDPYNRGKLWQSNNDGVEWECLDNMQYFFDCTFRTYSYDSKPDLQCNGNLSWANVTPKEDVTNSFTIENIGTPLSYLDWKIYSWPSWGEWTFSNLSGTNLKPEDGLLTIQVTLQAPNFTNNRYSGEIKIINTNNKEDFCIIACTLATPKSKIIFELNKPNYFENILQFMKKLNNFNLYKLF